MNNNETQLLNSVLAIAALSANISPEELKEYVNALSVDSSKVRSDDRFNDADILRSAVGLLRVYRDETIAKMVPAERHPFLRKITPAIGMLEECMKRYYKRIVAVDRALKCLIAKYPAAVFYAFVCPTGSLQHFDALTRHDSA